MVETGSPYKNICNYSVRDGYADPRHKNLRSGGSGKPAKRNKLPGPGAVAMVRIWVYIFVVNPRRRNAMKKNLFFLLFVFSINFTHAGIIDKLEEKDISKKLNFYDQGYMQDYMFSVYAEGDDLVVDIFTDTSSGASIMAYKINDGSAKIIIKYRTQDTVQVYRSKKYTFIDINYYYLIELEETDGKIESYCNRIDEINLNGFTINDAVAFKTTAARFGPAVTWRESVQLEEGTAVKVTAVEKEGTDDYNTCDHWYKIRVNKETHWVYGFYIDFNNRIKYKNK
jgi:hypothetical protein